MQKTILTDVLDIAGSIQKNASVSNELVQELGDSTGIVNTAVEEILMSTQSTAEHIQEQSVMTQTIQQSINETAEYSKKIVKIVENSGLSIGDNLQMMKELKIQSDHIGTTNKEVEESMRRLQAKTKEVQKKQ